MKPVINYIGNDTEAKKIFSQLANLFNTGLSADNLNGIFLEGTTSTTINTESLFKHNGRTMPVFAIPVTGNVYIESFDDTNIDVRSNNVSQNFKLFIILE